jgi:hypothetical protein
MTPLAPFSRVAPILPTPRADFHRPAARQLRHVGPAAFTKESFGNAFRDA